MSGWWWSTASEQHFAGHGWVLVPDACGPEVVAAAVGELDHWYPSGAAYAAHPDGFPDLAGGPFAGLRLWPTGAPVLDDLVVAEPFVALARHLIGSDGVRLLRAGFQAKYTGAADYEQVLHYDYPNHSLVVPAPNDVIGFFLYLSDIDEASGATRLVSAAAADGVAPDETHLAAGHPRYAQEVAAVGLAGSLLVYRSTTYHRGTAMSAPGGRRLTATFAFGRAEAWTGWASWPRLGEDEGLVAFIERAGPDVLPLLGFPGPADPYWTDTNATLVARRYPGLDLDRYLSR